MEYKNIYYTSNTDIYRSLDIFVPENTNDSTPVFIYFHGGGLESGSKEEIPYKCFIENNVCVVSINYRMYPYCRYPDYIWDCALGVKWVTEHIEQYANVSGVFIGGTSAGAYIAMMLCFDRKYLTVCGVDFSKIAGFVFNAGQPTTHFNILRERGMNPLKCVVDEAAPLYHIDEYNNQPPMLIFCADNDMVNRYELIQLLIGTLKCMNYPAENIYFELVRGHCHCDYIENDNLFAEKIIRFIIKTINRNGNVNKLSN